MDPSSPKHLLTGGRHDGRVHLHGTSGGYYALLGRNLPAAPVFSMQLVPGHPRQLVIASLGRGVYRYTFPVGQ
jgi:hypothetical protein